MGGVLLEYRYNRSFIDGDIRDSVKIDDDVRKLLDSFLTSNANTGTNKAGSGGICK